MARGRLNKKRRKRGRGPQSKAPKPSGSGTLDLKSDDRLRGDIRRKLDEGMDDAALLGTLWATVEPIIANHTQGMPPKKAEAFRDHIAVQLQEMVNEEAKGISTEKLRATIQKELDKTSHLDLMERAKQAILDNFNLSEEDQEGTFQQILQILREELAERTKRPFHTRLQEAMAKSLDDFRRVIVEETSQRSPTAVEQSVEAFIRKLAKKQPADADVVRALLGEALKTPIIFPEDVDRRRIEIMNQVTGPDPEPPPVYAAKKRDKPEEQSVESYLEAVSYALSVARHERDPDRRAMAMRYWDSLREARVIHIGQELYQVVHHTADRYTTETLAGQEWQPPNFGAVPQAEQKHFVNTLIREGKRQAYPDKLPFEAVFLGYATGVDEMLEHVDNHAPLKLRGRIQKGYLLGHVMDDTGLALAVRKAVLDDGSQVMWINECRVPDGGWIRGIDLEPWILPHLIQIINEHRTFVVEHGLTKQQRRDIKDNRKRFGHDYKHMPKPYYTLKVQSKVLEEKTQKAFSPPRKPMSYRTDVRAHERCRVRRGSLPIDPKLEEKLRKRGYRIFTGNRLDEETYRRLSERGMAYKKADEWLAIKVAWVDQHYTSNDERLPYIPAVRKLGSVRVEGKKFTGSWREDPASQ